MLKYLLYYAKDNKKVLSLHRLLVVNCKYYLNMRSWPTKRKKINYIQHKIVKLKKLKLCLKFKRKS